jgi:hypothetical protein
MLECSTKRVLRESTDLQEKGRVGCVGHLFTEDPKELKQPSINLFITQASFQAGSISISESQPPSREYLKAGPFHFRKIMAKNHWFKQLIV